MLTLRRSRRPWQWVEIQTLPQPKAETEKLWETVSQRLGGADHSLPQNTGARGRVRAGVGGRTSGGSHQVNDPAPIWGMAMNPKSPERSGS